MKAKGGEGLAKVVDVPGEVDFSTGHNLAQEGELDFINLREPKSKSMVFAVSVIIKGMTFGQLSFSLKQVVEFE